MRAFGIIFSVWMVAIFISAIFGSFTIGIILATLMGFGLTKDYPQYHFHIVSSIVLLIIIIALA